MPIQLSSYMLEVLEVPRTVVSTWCTLLTTGGVFRVCFLQLVPMAAWKSIPWLKNRPLHWAPSRIRQRAVRIRQRFSSKLSTISPLREVVVALATLLCSAPYQVVCNCAVYTVRCIVQSGVLLAKASVAIGSDTVQIRFRY